MLRTMSVRSYIKIRNSKSKKYIMVDKVWPIDKIIYFQDFLKCKRLRIIDETKTFLIIEYS